MAAGQLQTPPLQAYVVPDGLFEGARFVTGGTGASGNRPAAALRGFGLTLGRFIRGYAFLF